MQLLLNLSALLASPGRLARALDPQRVPPGTRREVEWQVVGQRLTQLFVQPRSFVCLRRREFAGKAPYRYHLRPVSSLIAGEGEVRQGVGLICEYNAALRVLRVVKWEPIKVQALSEQERVYKGEVCFAEFHHTVTYSDSAAVSFLERLPEGDADLETPLKQWHDYLDWRKRLAREKAEVRYTYTEMEVLPDRTSVRFYLRDAYSADDLRQRLGNEELKVLSPETSTRIEQGAFKSLRLEKPTANQRPGEGGSLSLVLEFASPREGAARPSGEGFLQVAMEGELAALDVQVQGLARLGEGRALNPRLRTWLFDMAKAEAVPAPDRDWRPDRKLNPEQHACVGRALALTDVLLLWGPPGTGKTSVIAEICSQLGRRGQRVLISSQANLAVIQALERLPRLRHIRPVFRTSATRRDSTVPPVRDFIKRWLYAVADSADAAQEVETDATWKNLLGDWALRLKAIRDDDLTPTLEQLYLKQANVVGATCNETGKTEFLTSSVINPAFDLAIVDEVSKATPPEMLLPLLLGRRVMLVGDHRQLPPMFRDVSFEEARDNADVTPESIAQFREMVTASLFDRYFRTAPPSVRHSLTRQYRMHPHIMEAVNHFYADSPLLAGDGDAGFAPSKRHGLSLRNRRGRPWLQTGHHFVWVDTARDAIGRPAREESHGTSRKNAVEAEVCAEIVASLFNTPGGRALEVAVISFYKAQVGLLRDRLRAAQTADWPDFDLLRDVNTVDQFQGSERDVVIVSLVRTGPRLTGEFVRDFRRINVAFSRARKLLIVLGSRDTFASADVTVPSAKEGPDEARRVYASLQAMAQTAGAALDVSDLLAPPLVAPRSPSA